MKPSLAQGTRDFGAEVVAKRNYIIQIIRKHFELYGFSPLETPAFENLETLTGKYGEEGDKLMFKILNNGLERPEKHQKSRDEFEEVLQGKSKKGITERALRYDLTIPFARYVAMQAGHLNFPFKRYQIQPVWRADKPQRGRYREFYQCDADIVGSNSLFNESELLQLYADVFQDLKIPVDICINNRMILSDLAVKCGDIHLLTPMTVAIDKLDKIGMNGVMTELQAKGFQESARQCISEFLELSKLPVHEIAPGLVQFFGEETKGIQDIKQFIALEIPGVRIDLTLARGLNYYTGTIIEVKPIGVQMGSLGGGGRYDNLTELFDLPGISGVGISFGLDRIYDVLEETNGFPSTIQSGPQVMLVNFGPSFESANRSILQRLRQEGISCEMYPESIKADKQLKYANKRNIPFVILIGENELKDHTITIKNFQTGLQESFPENEFISSVQSVIISKL
ncbi:MAG: histidine--tRNA ligase [Chitinophagaceae bacterium]|nr:histidine--tRNA ligase [Chitinophagaceae bacterium]